MSYDITTSAPYLCPLSGKPPRCPVITNTGIIYDFVSIAKVLLNDVNAPVITDSISMLYYHSGIQEFNDKRMEVVPLSIEEKDEIETFFWRLQQKDLPYRGYHNYLHYKILHVNSRPKKLANEPLERESSLLDAAYMGFADKVRIALDYDNINPNSVNEDGKTALYLAARKNNLEIIAILLADKRVNVNQQSLSGTTPLFIVAQEGYLGIVKALLADPRVNPNQAMTDGTTPLVVAAYKGHLQIVKALLEDLRVDPNQAMSDGRTPLAVAAYKGHLQIVKALLEDPRVDPNQATTDGRTPLAFAVYKGHLQIVKAFLEDPRVGPNQATTDGTTPLAVAAYKGDLQIVMALLEDPRVDPNQAMSDGTTPLYIAILWGHFDVAQALLRHQKLAENALSTVAEEGYSALVRDCLSNPTHRNYYIHQLIKKPDLMSQAMSQNPDFFNEFKKYSSDIWAYLKEPDLCGLAPDKHRSLLTRILDSQKKTGDDQKYPLYRLFQQESSFFFFYYTNNRILDEIRTYLETGDKFELSKRI